MKSHPFHTPRATKGLYPRKSQKGIALFIVLAVLVLISVLVIAFFSSITAEVSSARSYASGATVKQLADSAVQLVVAQIADGTSGKNVNSGTVAWASQPGMIRTYNTSGVSDTFYKLYSANLPLAVSGTAVTAFNPATDTPPVGWNDPSNQALYQQYQGLYTDLNSPVTHDGNTYFPIIDGNSIKPLTLSGSQVLTYSTSGSAADIEGFSVDPAKVNYSSAKALSGTNNPVTMPVKWLYVLQDGKIASPASSSNGTVTFDPAYPVPSTPNPIVGRIAFWTDDETCKVNINTASEGTFWDRPWANNITEQNYATAIPAQNEFQRFPGHPAKTSLSTIFGSILPSPGLSNSWYFGISGGQQTTNENQLKAYYDLIPRVADGGTRGGNVNEATATGGTNASFTTITPDADRLYASTDEFLYGTTLSGSTRAQNNALIVNTLLEKTKFFTTANSRAPEVNLFGKPRMALWPIQMDATQRNAKDKLIAFCSTIGGNPYYFQRFSTYSSPSSIGAGAPSASSQSATLDWTGVTRNQTLYSYIDQLTQQDIPGFGGNFANKYSTGRQQIITEMFDMIRSGVNAYSNGLAPQYSYAPSYLDPGEGQIVPLIPPAGTPGAGTRGFGRFITITGAAMNFFRSNTAYYSTTGTTSNFPVKIDPAAVDAQVNPNGVVISPNAQVGGTLILNPFTPSPGFPPWSPNVQYVITGLDSFQINGTSMGFPKNTPLKNTVTSRAEFTGMWNCTPFFNVIPSFRYAVTSGSTGTDGTKTVGFTNPITQYPFSVPTSTSTTGSPPLSGVQLPAGAKTFDFSGGTITITVYSGSDGDPTSASSIPSTPIQTITMVFPPVKGLRVPTSVPTWASSVPATVPGVTFNSRVGEGTDSNLQKPWRVRLINYLPVPATTPTYASNAAALGNGLDTNGQTVKYWSEDVARGIEGDAIAGPARGDYRDYAVLSATNYFTACQAYDSPPGGPQQYGNIQTLRDEGLDGGAQGGLGYDNAEPSGYYTHYPNNAAGVSAARDQVSISSISSGVLIPQSFLAHYGGANGNGSAANTQEYRATAHPAVPNGLTGAFLSNGNYGDWDNAAGQVMDGPFINKPDEGNSSTVSNTASRTNIAAYYGTTDISGGYFTMGLGIGDYNAESGQTFSPNRQIASAVMFGSLPTGIDPASPATPKPWQTLLFCPNPAANSSPGATPGASHPGFGTSLAGTGDSGPPYSVPPDSLLLDLFTMPIVEPYAISEPLSTGGKINMNYQIAPFTYIKRDTGVRAVLKATRIMAIPQGVSTLTTATNSYKDGQRCAYEFRYNINPDEVMGTLAGFETRFNNNDIFRSASEICGIYLVPQLIPTLSTGTSYPPGSTPPTSYAATAAWWNNFMLTGDNTREMPYGDIYARLTTKSNTYTVHTRVQTLKKVPGTPAVQWVEGRDQITGEYRGSQMIERYIDANDPNLQNTANDFTLSSAPSAETYYKIRLLNSTTFTP